MQNSGVNPLSGKNNAMTSVQHRWLSGQGVNRQPDYPAAEFSSRVCPMRVSRSIQVWAQRAFHPSPGTLSQRPR